MKTIQTKYKGYYFRSRLEARWAVFFDSLGVEWEYEKEGFHFEGGTNYLPDFWLPQVNMWAEVKGEEFNKEEIKKAENLAKESKHPVLMLIGMPENKVYYAIEGSSFLPGCEFDGEYCLTNYHNYPKDEGRFYSMPGESSDEFDEHFPDTAKAVTAAKSARFEFGDEEK